MSRSPHDGPSERIDATSAFPSVDDARVLVARGRGGEAVLAWDGPDGEQRVMALDPDHLLDLLYKIRRAQARPVIDSAIVVGPPENPRTHYVDVDGYRTAAEALRLAREAKEALSVDARTDPGGGPV